MSVPRVYALVLAEQETGRIIVDVKDIPEHVVQRIGQILAAAMPLANAVRAGVLAANAMQDGAAAVQDAIAGLGALVPAKRARARRGRR